MLKKAWEGFEIDSLDVFSPLGLYAAFKCFVCCSMFGQSYLILVLGSHGQRKRDSESWSISWSASSYLYVHTVCPVPLDVIRRLRSMIFASTRVVFCSFIIYKLMKYIQINEIQKILMK